MKYTIEELSNILGIKKTAIWKWINNGIISVHTHQTGERLKLKAEFIPEGKGKGYYLISTSDIDEFLSELYYNSYFYKWWRK